VLPSDLRSAEAESSAPCICWLDARRGAARPALDDSSASLPGLKLPLALRFGARCRRQGCRMRLLFTACRLPRPWPKRRRPLNLAVDPASAIQIGCRRPADPEAEGAWGLSSITELLVVGGRPWLSTRCLTRSASSNVEAVLLLERQLEDAPSASQCGPTAPAGFLSTGCGLIGLFPLARHRRRSFPDPWGPSTARDAAGYRWVATFDRNRMPSFRPKPSKPGAGPSMGRWLKALRSLSWQVSAIELLVCGIGSGWETGSAAIGSRRGVVGCGEAP